MSDNLASLCSAIEHLLFVYHVTPAHFVPQPVAEAIIHLSSAYITLYPPDSVQTEFVSERKGGR